MVVTPSRGIRNRTWSERFWAKVAKGGPDDCWIWQASQYCNGYGQFKWNGAHRFSYEEANGPIPDGLVIDHLCQRRLCVNPAHLEAVPQSVNVRRGYAAPVAVARMKARARARTACSRGHELTPENTYIHRSRAIRLCRTCRADDARTRRAAARLPGTAA